ncbi:glycoside hydrolase family 2 [Streptomyces hygroscopicus subsp. hygroscopicus]|uniref:glycoside hydrolase family 2 protein n=1 Tax=Streptomyces hygroscopicus TaxID=1912 RepID=UPI001C65A552|nr:sugar-binding domain-containing protein [Streptomyces hygroscopicus]MBW8086498.1 glycoside hydrolase family 2 [Streptomyces hygroscopicus subsp. hygroscopicus]
MPVPRPEYPNPLFDRSHAWLNLNGSWDFRADPAQQHTAAAADGYDQRITVPFAWETPASGIAAHWLETAWYRRTFTVPSAWSGQRVVLHFGAVHHEATVWVNDTEVAHHEGGYTPFSADVTDALGDGEQLLVVRVHAPADKLDIVHGKQRSMPRDDYDGVCFTPSSGIWQTVWLESRPATHLATLRLRPAHDLTGIAVDATVRGPESGTARLRLRVRGEDSTVTLDIGPDGRAEAVLPVATPRLWSPEDPHLYSVDAELTSADGTDRVTSYTGLRSIAVDGEALYLNGHRLFIRGVLDQGYWPDTGITAPDDAALRRDLELAADAGYNLVRKHLKLEDPRFVHHADTLGMLLWAEPASPGRFSPESTARFAEQIQPMVERDGNSPAIIIWGLYNEEWGLDWDLPGDPAKQQAVADAYDLLKALDPTRPAVDNSGWTHVKTDLLDWHYYDESAASWAATVADLLSGRRDDFPVKLGPDFVVHKQLAVTGQPLRGLPNLNSEYGGGFTGLDRAWHLRWQTQELRRHDRLAGYVYTELYDIEHESAGLLDFHRGAKDLAGVDPGHVNAPTTLVLDLTPVAPGRDLLTATREFTVGVRVSHHGTEPVEGTLHTTWTAVYAAAPESPGSPVPGCHAEAKPYVLGEAVEVPATLPEGRTSGRLHLALVAEGGSVVARTALDVDTRTAPHIGDDPRAGRTE